MRNMEGRMPGEEFIGRRIKIWREHVKDWSQKELSKRSGVDRSNISQIENGEISTGLNRFGKIVHAFGISYTEFFGRFGNRSTIPGKVKNTLKKKNKASDGTDEK